MKVEIPPVNVAELVGRAAAGRGGETALVDGDRRVTWRDLDRAISETAGGLVSLGLVAGHRVAVAMANSVEFVVTYLAVLRAGLVAVPFSTVSRPREVARMLADSGARVCFADAETIGVIRSAVAEQRAGSSPLVVVHGVEPAEAEAGYESVRSTDTEPASPLDAETLALLLYTSGTSGRPRAVMHTHRALLANIAQAAAIRPAPMQPDDVVLGVVPLSHIYGLNAILGQVLNHGSTLVLGHRFDAEETLRLVEAERVTLLPVAPPVVVAWVRSGVSGTRFASVRTLLSGAGAVDAETARAFEESTGVAVEQGYGLTEAGPVVTMTIGTPRHKPGSAGRAVPGVDVTVVDSTGSVAEPGDPGEIRVRGENLFSGYWPDGDGAPDADGWFATGDVGYVDEDGDLFLIDRLREVVSVSGFSVYPSEIEDLVAEVEGVVECAVIGDPDGAAAQTVVAYVVPEEDPAGHHLRERVLAHCQERLARFKVPSRIEIVAELPHAVTGNVARGRLRAAQQRRRMGLS